MMLKNVSFRDCISIGNSGFGWILSPHMLNASSRPLSIVVDNLTVIGSETPPPNDAAHPSWRPGMGIGITGVNEAGAMRKGWGSGTLRGSIVIANSTVRDTWGSGLFITSKGSHAASLLLSNVSFDNVQRQKKGAHCPAPVSKSCPPPGGSYAVPLEIGGNSNSCFETGGIRLANCSVVDSWDRPFIELNNIAGKCAKTKSGEWGLANITGALEVTNRFGCRYSEPANGSDIALTVDCVNSSRDDPPLLADSLHVKCRHDQLSNCTAAIQAALDAPTAHSITIEAAADLSEINVEPLFVRRSDRTIILMPGVKLIALKGSFKGLHDSLLSVVGVRNVTIIATGAVLQMRKLDYLPFNGYVKGEWRMALQIRASRGITVLGGTLLDAGGE